MSSFQSPNERDGVVSGSTETSYVRFERQPFWVGFLHRGGHWALLLLVGLLVIAYVFHHVQVTVTWR